jgi:hypothetical protein
MTTYKEIEQKGKEESSINQKIISAMYNEETISNKPFTLHISLKVRNVGLMHSLYFHTRKKLNETLIEGVDYSAKIID